MTVTVKVYSPDWLKSTVGFGRLGLKLGAGRRRRVLEAPRNRLGPSLAGRRSPWPRVATRLRLGTRGSGCRRSGWTGRAVRLAGQGGVALVALVAAPAHVNDDRGRLRAAAIGMAHLIVRLIVRPRQVRGGVRRARRSVAPMDDVGRVHFPGDCRVARIIVADRERAFPATHAGIEQGTDLHTLVIVLVDRKTPVRIIGRGGNCVVRVRAGGNRIEVGDTGPVVDDRLDAAVAPVDGPAFDGLRVEGLRGIRWEQVQRVGDARYRIARAGNARIGGTAFTAVAPLKSLYVTVILSSVTPPLGAW